MSALTLPALIVKAPFAGLLCDGLPHHADAAIRLHKTVECRGPRAAAQLATYRGAVAIFVSASYDRADADHIARWYWRQLKRRSAAPPLDVVVHVHAYCSMIAAAWRYRLLGYVSLRDVTTAEQARSDRELHRWRMAATDYGGSWQVATYLHTEPLHSYQTADGLPRFDAACVGCQASPPHNGAACHVNVQTVRLSARIVPPTVQKRIAPWPV